MKEELKIPKLTGQQRQEIMDSFQNLGKYMIFQKNFAQNNFKLSQTQKLVQTSNQGLATSNKSQEIIEQKVTNNQIAKQNNDWTEGNNLEPNQAKISDSELIENTYDYDKISVTQTYPNEQMLLQIDAQLKNQGDPIDSEQYRRYFDSLTQQSHDIYKRYIWNVYQKIDSTKSSINLFIKQITYPISKVFIVCKPRNIFGTLPGLMPRDQYDSQEAYIKIRDNTLLNLAQTITNQIIGSYTYGALSFEEGKQVIQFDTIQTMYYNAQSSPQCIKEILDQSLENQEIILVSRQFVQAFQIHSDDIAEINSAYVDIVNHKLISYEELKPTSKKQIEYYHKPEIPIAKLAISIDKQNVDQDKNLAEAQNTTQTYVNSLDLKWNFSHYNSDKGASQLGKKNSQKMIHYGLGQGIFKTHKSGKTIDRIFTTGIIDLQLIQEQQTDKDLLKIRNKLETNKFFIKTGNMGITNYQYPLNFQFMPKNNVYILFPRIQLKFNYLTEVYQMSQISIVPCFNIIKGNGKIYFNGLIAHNVAQSQPLQLSFNMTSKIFSHVLLQLNSVQESLGIGFQFQSGEQIIIDLAQGTVSKSDKQKLNIQILQKEKLQKDDFICLHYFISQKTVQFLHIHLIRDKTIKSLTLIEVPEDDCTNLITLNNENDVISIIKGQINAISIKDSQESEKKRK